MAANVPGKNYYSIRNKLLFQSLVFNEITDKLRKYYGIPNNPLKPSENTVVYIHKAKNHWVTSKYPDKAQKYFEDFKTKYGKSFDDNYLYALAADKLRKEVFYPLHRIADLLILDRGQLEEYILFDIYPRGQPSQVRLVLAKDFPVEEPGVYLKILPNTKMYDLITAYKQIGWLAKNLFRDQYGIKARRKSTSYQPKEELALYAKIEAKIRQNYKLRKKDKKEYRKIIGYAIENLVGDNMPKNIDNDKEWDNLFKLRCKRLEVDYYDITDRYNLPTLRDLLLFLRLIPNN